VYRFNHVCLGILYYVTKYSYIKSYSHKVITYKDLVRNSKIDCICIWTRRQCCALGYTGCKLVMLLSVLRIVVYSQIKNLSYHFWKCLAVKRVLGCQSWTLWTYRLSLHFFKTNFTMCLHLSEKTYSQSEIVAIS